jgi:hypothetical protein
MHLQIPDAEVILEIEGLTDYLLTSKLPDAISNLRSRTI